MKISTQTVENGQAVVQIEVEAQELEESLDKAYRQVVKRVAIPGFRKGKAPRSVVERHIGREGLQKEALEDLIPELCARAVEEQKMEVIAQPAIEILQLEPVIFKATFPLRPRVELGDYRSVRVERPAVEVTEEQIDSVLDKLRERRAVWSPVQRPVGLEDLVTADIEEESPEGGTKKYEGRQIIMVKESVYPLPEFPEKLVGMSVGEDKEFDLSYAPDYKFAELAGKQYKLKVKVTEVKEKRLPEVDEEFVKSLDQGLESVEALRGSIAENLRRAAEEASRRDQERGAVEALAAGATVEFPPILVEQEIEDLIREREMMFRNQGGLEAYLKSMKKSEEQMREEFRPKAIERVTHSLVLGKLAEVEGITADEAEVNAEIDRMSDEGGERGADIRRIFDSHEGHHVIENRLISRKALERLAEIVSGGDEGKASEV
jgi:trigger factor